MAAQAIYQKRNFTNKVTGEIVSYDFYGLRITTDDEVMELKLENLSNAEKIIFKMYATLNDDSDESFDVTSRKANSNELPGVEKRSAADDFFESMNE